jgi:cysteinyl-tRNA synthetase
MSSTKASFATTIPLFPKGDGEQEQWPPHSEQSQVACTIGGFSFMGLAIYNTLSRQKEAFVPQQPGQVTMYVCGVTVYASSHIGHAMSALTFDIIRRYLEYRNFQVKHVLNFTDIDDKIIQRAQAEQIDWRAH